MRALRRPLRLRRLLCLLRSDRTLRAAFALACASAVAVATGVNGASALVVGGLCSINADGTGPARTRAGRLAAVMAAGAAGTVLGCLVHSSGPGQIAAMAASGLAAGVLWPKGQAAQLAGLKLMILTCIGFGLGARVPVGQAAGLYLLGCAPMLALVAAGVVADRFGPRGVARAGAGRPYGRRHDGRRPRAAAAPFGPRRWKAAAPFGPRLRKPAASRGPRVRVAVVELRPRLRRAAASPGPRVRVAVVELRPRVRRVAVSLGPRVRTAAALLRPTAPDLRHALRLAGCVALAAAVAVALHPRHASWLPLTACLVFRLDAMPLHRRALHRAAGTLAGVLVAAALAVLAPHGGVLVVVAVVVGALVPGVTDRSYAGHTSLATVIVLVLANPAAVAGPAETAARVVDTLLACLVALAFGHVVWPRHRTHPFQRRPFRPRRASADGAA